MAMQQFVSLGLVLVAVGVILLVYRRPRRPAKAESEKRSGQARRRRFIKVGQEKRLGLPRRSRDCPPDPMGDIGTDEVDTLAAYLTRAAQQDVSTIRDYKRVEQRKSPRRVISHYRDATSWHLNVANRRQSPGRRWGDVF
ncbi:MAG: hypothetical protein ACE5FE_06450 [Acidiferrobacterales bacterium]